VLLGFLVDLGGGRLDAFLLFRGQVRNELGWVSAPLLAGWDSGVRRYDGAWFEYYVRLDQASLKDGALLADGHEIVDAAALQDRTSAHSDVMADMADWWEARLERSVLGESADDAALTDARRESDRDWMLLVSPDDGSVPHARLVPVGDLSDDRCGRGDEGVVSDEWALAEEGHLWPVPREDLAAILLSQKGSGLAESTSDMALQDFARHVFSCLSIDGQSSSIRALSVSPIEREMEEQVVAVLSSVSSFVGLDA